MRLPRGVAVSSYVVLLFACVALHAPAQVPSSPTAADCPECDSLVRVVAADEAALDRLRAELRNEQDKAARARAAATAAGNKFDPADAKGYDDNIARAQQRYNAQDQLVLKDLGKLITCRGKCAMRGQLSPLPPEIPPVRYPEPAAACLACIDRATSALETRFELANLEEHYFFRRSSAFSEYDWLLKHASVRNDAEYLYHISSYANYLYDLAQMQNDINDARQKLDRAMDRLADCNANCPKDSGVPGMGTLVVPAPVPGSDDEEPKAACADCEGAELKLKTDLARLRREKALQVLDAAERAAIEGKRKGRDRTAAEQDRIDLLDKVLEVSSSDQATVQHDIHYDRIALDLCNMKCPPKTTRPYVTPLPGGPFDPAGTGVPKETERIDDDKKAPPQPQTEVKPLSTGGFVAPPNRPYTFTFSLGPGFVTDKAPSIGEVKDNPFLPGTRSIGGIFWRLLFDPPGWLWEVGGTDGHRSTSGQVPVGTESGWAYHMTAPNGSTGISSAGGANATLKTKYQELHLNLTLPSALLRDEGSWKVFGEPTVGLRYSKLTYSGMISNLSIPSISSTTDQGVKEYDVRAGYGIHGERTFPNRLVGSVGVGAEAIYYHANYDGTQDNVCPVCSAATQNFNVSTSDSRNRLSLGVSANAGLSYPVSEKASIFLTGMYRYEFGAPTLVNKIIPTDAAPHLDKGGREFGTVQFGFEIKF